jgi:menaquinone-dependent protoporphyrinogen IX oxidase
MNIEYFHASRFGNGARVAAEFARRMAARGVTVSVHHIRDARPEALPAADLYVFSSPGQWGKPIRRVRRFLSQIILPAGTPYALLTTEMGPPKPDKTTGRVPTEEEIAKYQRVRPIINELLQAAGLVRVAEEKVYVTGVKGPLEDGWQDKVEAFAARLPLQLETPHG